MKQTILLIAVVGCGEKDEALQTPPESKATPKLEAKKPEANKVESKPLFDLNNEAHVMIDHVTVEAAIRWLIDKPTGERTKADLEKVTKLYLDDNLLADVSAVEDFKRLKQLKELDLMINPDLTTDEIVKLQKALPKCEIIHNATQ